MNTASTDSKISHSWPIHGRIEECEKRLQEYWNDNPELLHIVDALLNVNHFL